MPLTSVEKRRGIQLLGELVARGIVGHDEALKAVLAANGHPADGTARRCALAWALTDAVNGWLRNYDRAIWAALRATQYAITAGERAAEPLFRTALAEADRILPGAISRDVLQPLLAQQWAAFGRRR